MPEISKIERKNVIYDIKDEVARSLVSGKYSKPVNGIPKEDLSYDVQKLLEKAGSSMQEETDPTVPEWAKSATKPSYTASEVGALSEDTQIPDKVSELENDSGYTSNIGTITGVQMNGINYGTSGMVNLGNVLTHHQDLSGKQDVLVSGSNIKTVHGQSILGSGDIPSFNTEYNAETETLTLL